MNKLIPPVLATAAIVVPTGIVWTATHSQAQNAAVGSTAAAKHATPTRTATKAASKTLKIQGPGVDMEWGTVQVTIVVKGKTVTDLTATAPTERARSAYINNIAVPMLRKEVLQAKTVANIQKIYGISGATMTSDAFYQSLLAALKTAHLT